MGTMKSASRISSCSLASVGLVACLVLSPAARAFTPMRTATTSVSRRPSPTQQFLTPDALPDPFALQQLHDLLATTTSAASSPGVVDPSSLLDSAAVSTQWLADAAEAAVEAAAEASDSPGWWTSYLNIFKSALEFVHSTIDQPLRSVGWDQTWGISIFLFTIAIRSLLIPLSIQQSKASEYMKALKPYTEKIRQKYEGDEETINKATGKLYEDAQQNPLSGCLVALAQLPIFLGLYRGVRLLAMDGKLDEPFLWIPSLEGPVSPPDYRGLDWLVQGWTEPADGGLPIPQLGWETTLAFLAVPVLLVFLQSFTMAALQPPIDENMKEDEKEQMENSQRLLKFLPLLIGFFSIQVPAGLTIYWVATNLFTLTQSTAVRAYYAANPPEIELPDYWSALDGDTDNFENLTPEERRKLVEGGLRVGPTFEDLVDEARFHAYLSRHPIRQDSAAWKRIQESDDPLTQLVAAELREWVAAAPALMPEPEIVTKVDINDQHAATTAPTVAATDPQKAAAVE